MSYFLFKALDLLLDEMKNDGFDFSSIKALSGAGQVSVNPCSPKTLYICFQSIVRLNKIPLKFVRYLVVMPS